MRLVVALGGNALQRRGEAPDAARSRERVAAAAEVLAALALEHDLVVTHGNGPQVGRFAVGTGGLAAIGALDQAEAVLRGQAGTRVGAEGTGPRGG